jgi:hypothetical protein
MTGCGTTTFIDPDDFRVALPGLTIDLSLTGSVRFQARLAWFRMAELSVAQVEESAPRVASLSVRTRSVLVSFPLSNNPPVVFNGIALRPGQVLLHGAGERFHQRIAGAARWGMAWLSCSTLEAWGSALLGTNPVLPATEVVLAPSASTVRFRRLHAQACRLVWTKPDIAAHPEVTRALEQDLIHALVHALSDDPSQADALNGRRRASRGGR